MNSASRAFKLMNCLNFLVLAALDAAVGFSCSGLESPAASSARANAETNLAASPCINLYNSVADGSEFAY